MFKMHVACGLCQSSSDGVEICFIHYGASYVQYFMNSKNLTAETSTLIPTKFSSTIKISKYPSWVADRGRSLLSTTALLTFGSSARRSLSRENAQCA